MNSRPVRLKLINKLLMNKTRPGYINLLFPWEACPPASPPPQKQIYVKIDFITTAENLNKFNALSFLKQRYLKGLRAIYIADR